jgi:hypothetical protein
MKDRTEQQVEDILGFIKSKWELSPLEEDTLDSVLTLFSAKKTDEIKQLSYLMNGEEEQLLQTLYQRGIESYASEEFDLVSANDEFDLVDALNHLNYDFSSNVSDTEMIKYLEEDGWTVVWDKNEIKTDFDYVDTELYQDIYEKFESLNIFDRERLRNEVIKFK